MFCADAPRILKVNIVTGASTLVAGSGTPGLSGDGGPPIDARLGSTAAIAADVIGNLVIADTENHRIRRLWRAARVSVNDMSVMEGDTGTRSVSFIVHIEPAQTELRGVHSRRPTAPLTRERTTRPPLATPPSGRGRRRRTSSSPSWETASRKVMKPSTCGSTRFLGPRWRTPSPRAPSSATTIRLRASARRACPAERGMAPFPSAFPSPCPRHARYRSRWPTRPSRGPRLPAPTLPPNPAFSPSSLGSRR